MSNSTRKPSIILERRYEKQGSCCYYCKTKVKFESITQDHIVPKSKGGKLTNNSVFCCSPCNSAKANLDVEEFKFKVLQKLLAVLRQVSNNGFKASQSAVDKFKHYYMLFKTLDDLQLNNFKPTFDKVVTK